MRLTRDVGGIVMDLSRVEVVTVNARGGADTAAVNDLSGTGVTDVMLNLAAQVAAGSPACPTARRIP